MKCRFKSRSWNFFSGWPRSKPNYQAKITINCAYPKYWACDKLEKIIDHVVPGCFIMTPNEYLQRHDQVGQYIHWKIWQQYNSPFAKNWYKQKPQKVVETESVTILWDFPIRTDRAIQANKPDITIKDHREKTFKLMDFTFPMDINISTKEFEKLSKYKDIQIETQNLVIQNINDSNSCRCIRVSEKRVWKTSWNYYWWKSLVEIQKIVLSSTLHILKNHQYKLQQNQAKNRVTFFNYLLTYYVDISFHFMIYFLHYVIKYIYVLNYLFTMIIYFDIHIYIHYLFTLFIN